MIRPSDYPREKTIHQLFEEQVEKTPHNTAIVYEETSLSYQALNQRANQLARFIRNQYQDETGDMLSPDTLIPLCLDRSLEMIIAILAVLKAGGAYVPIDPELPLTRKEHMIHDTKACLILTYSGLRDGLPTNIAKVIFVDEMEDYSQLQTSNLETVMTSRNLAYVIYTSGSTGVPKGVMIEHISIHNVLFNLSNFYNEMGVRSVLGLTSYAFDIFALEAFIMWLCGGSLYLVRGESESLIAQVVTMIDFLKPDLVQATPSLWKIISREVIQLPYCICGGEAGSINLLSDLYKKSRHLSHVYGPTETTVWSAQGTISPNNFSIGKANWKYNMLYTRF